MAVQMRPVRVHNPPRKKNSTRSKTAKRAVSKKRSSHKPRKKRSNPGYLAVVGPINPNKGGAMKSRKKNSHRRPRARKSNARRRNPFNTKALAVRGTRHRRKSNPGAVKAVTRIMVLGFWALVGLVLVRQLPQMVLGAKNTGFVGYLANLGVAAGISMIALKSVGEDAATGLAVGGGVYVTNRVIQDHLSPIGKYLSISGLGDAMALGGIVTDDTAYRPFPIVYAQDGQPWIPPEIDARKAMAMIAAAKAAPPSGMGHLSRGHLAA